MTSPRTALMAAALSFVGCGTDVETSLIVDIDASRYDVPTEFSYLKMDIYDPDDRTVIVDSHFFCCIEENVEPSVTLHKGDSSFEIFGLVVSGYVNPADTAAVTQSARRSGTFIDGEVTRLQTPVLLPRAP